MRRRIVYALLFGFVALLFAGNSRRSLEYVDDVKGREMQFKLSLLAKQVDTTCENVSKDVQRLYIEDPIFANGSDSWGNALRLKQEKAGQWELRSSGADQKSGTEDDILVQILCK